MSESSNVTKVTELYKWFGTTYLKNIIHVKTKCLNVASMSYNMLMT